jgi:hypothetical protein
VIPTGQVPTATLGALRPLLEAKTCRSFRFSRSADFDPESVVEALRWTARKRHWSMFTG